MPPGRVTAGYHWRALGRTPALPARPGQGGRRAAAAAAAAAVAVAAAAAAAGPASPAAPSSWRPPAAGAAAPSASGFLPGGASVPLSLSGTTSFLRLHQETATENTRGLLTVAHKPGDHPRPLRQTQKRHFLKPL